VTPRNGALGSDTRGVVYVEFIFAFLPIFLLFCGLFQLGMVQLADLVTKHAAEVATRAAIVVLPDDPNFYGGAALNHPVGARLTDITTATTETLQAIDPKPQVTLTFPSTAGGSDSRDAFGMWDLVRVQVHYTYPCRIPIGALLVCGADAKKTLVGESVMMNQGCNLPYASQAQAAGGL
jgi:Flp pilus assembly protein TadG